MTSLFIFILACISLAGIAILWKLVFSNPTFGKVVDEKLRVNKHLAFTVATCVGVVGLLLNQVLLVALTLMFVSFCLGIFVTSPEADAHITKIKNKFNSVP